MQNRAGRARVQDSICLLVFRRDVVLRSKPKSCVYGTCLALKRNKHPQGKCTSPPRPSLAHEDLPSNTTFPTCHFSHFLLNSNPLHPPFIVHGLCYRGNPLIASQSNHFESTGLYHIEQVSSAFLIWCLSITLSWSLAHWNHNNVVFIHHYQELPMTLCNC